jgi:deoxyribonuclease-4
VTTAAEARWPNCYDGILRIGIHTSIAGALENGALKAAELGANTFQIFSSSPRMWRASTPGRTEIDALRNARQRFGLDPLAIHVNYLVNLASADPVIRAKSVAAFRAELQRAEAIGAEFLVVHPGSYRGQTLEEGIARAARAIGEAARGIAAPRAALLLENTVGCGQQIGARFEELRQLHDSAQELTDLPIGYCLDTCHLLAAGFDVSREDGLRRTVREAGRVLGMENVRLIHANDSMFPAGSCRDRHQHIGEGFIGKAGFRRILAHPELRSKPFILETPVDHPGDDRRNLDTLKKLCPKSRTTTTRSN